jgi:hypothetical protein
MKVDEIIIVVDHFNGKWFELTKDEERLPFEYVYASHWQGIKFFDDIIWDDEDYDVEYKNNEALEGFFDTDPEPEYETIYECIERRVNAFTDLIRNFKL